MFRVRFVCLLLAMLLVLTLPAAAAEVDCDATYCFSSSDFTADEPIVGICITSLPAVQTGTVLLGSRVLQPGDILTAQQLSQMTFSPLRTEEDAQAVVTYLPIYENRVAPSATMTISIRGKEDKAPVAQDSAVETYKNLPNQGKLSVSDPEGQALTYTLIRQPRRGQVQLNEDGTFLYTPKKNKVGVDSFTFTAADPAGNVSREATVTIQILKPTDARQYTDTAGLSCRFAAEWMRNSGLFIGEQIGGEDCFFPDKTVSRGEFLTMLLQVLDIPKEDTSYAAVPSDTPLWLKPYVGAALRSGLISGLPETSMDAASMCQPITGAEVAVLLQNALDLRVSHQIPEELTELPVWAVHALSAMADNGISLTATAPMTRAQAAEILYQVHYLSVTAPGAAVLRLQ